MDMNNSVCHTCKTKFHHCGGCGCDGYSEKGYCSWECFRDSDERKARIEIITRFLNSLTSEQFADFKMIDEFFTDDEYLVADLIDKMEKKK